MLELKSDSEHNGKMIYKSASGTKVSLIFFAGMDGTFHLFIHVFFSSSLAVTLRLQLWYQTRSAAAARSNKTSSFNSFQQLPSGP